MPPPAQFSLVDSLKNEARSSEEPPADRQAQSECLALFNLIDEDRSGQISKKEFLDAIRDNKEVKQYVYQSGTLGRLIATGDFEEAFLKLDVGGADGQDSNISFEEFWKFAQIENDEALIRKVFDAIDKNQDGDLTATELVTGLRDDPVVRKYALSSVILRPMLETEDWDGVFKRLDKDGGGKVDFMEFWKFTKDEAAHIEGQKLKKKAEIARIEAARIKKLNHEIFTSRFTCHTSSGASAGHYAIDQMDNVTIGKRMLG